MSRQNKIYSNFAKRFNLLQNEPLKPYTSFKIGGPAELFALPENTVQLTDLLLEAKKLNLPITIIGGGTNLLISDKGIRGLVIATRNFKSEIGIEEKTSDFTLIKTNAGERLSKLCKFATTQSLSGLEFAAGIPGTIGGAVIMNAGTPQGNMADIVDQVQVLNPDTLQTKIQQRPEIDFSYRTSTLSGILLAITLKLKKADMTKIRSIVTQNLNHKNKTQPMGVASAGCFFKNPTQGKPAGQLIEEAGLKGYTINDAQVSKLHANYILNLNNARCEDILELKKQIQKIVLNKFNIKLETEVRIEGE